MKDDDQFSEETMMKQIDEKLHDLLKRDPATNKQKFKLKALGIPFAKEITKSEAFFLIRQKINGIDFPGHLV